MAKKKVVEVIKKKSSPAPAKKAAPKRVFKQKRVLSGMSKVFRKWGDWDTDDQVVGKFVATHEDNYDKTNYVIEVIQAEFADDSGDEFTGKNLVLNSSGTIDKAFEEVTVGEFVQVTYLGKSEILKGKYAGKEAHNMEVIVIEDPDAPEVDDEEEVEEEDEEENDDDL